MTNDELVAWAAEHDMVLIAKDEHAELCAAAAEVIAESTDLDIEYQVLLGDA